VTARPVPLAAGLLLAVVSAGPARAEGVFCTPISAVPVTITDQGRYCVTAPLFFADGNGTAITIASDFVTIDFAGFTLDGTAGGSASTSTGIYAFDRRNLVIRGGRIRGFMYGIRFDDDASTGYTTGGSHQVEDMQLDACTFKPIWAQGRGVRVRGNLITRSGGSTFFASVNVAAIDVRGPGARVMSNTIVDTHGVGTGAGWGIWILGGDAIVEGNRLANDAVGAGTIGILVRAGSQATLAGNRVAGFERGARFEPGAGGVVRDNATSGCTTPYELNGALDAGHND
jgi:hypothetical protein